MLGMTIAEKVYGLEVGGSAPPPTITGLTTIREADSAFSLSQQMWLVAAEYTLCCK